MIDLSRNRAALLADIGAPDRTGEPLSDITDPRVAAADAHVRLCGRAREDLFPLLKIALSERFAAVPRHELIRDLLIPLRNVLGNAHKHGNGKDPTKAVCAEIVLTREGALIAVTDQGKGFDVALAFRRFQEQECYFVNQGVGFRNLHQAKSTVSYENGGRTVLLCFRPAKKQDPSDASFPCQVSTGDPSGAAGESAGGGHALPRVPGRVDLPEFRNGQATIESCRVYARRWRTGGDCGPRYLLRIAGHDGRPAVARILTGRLHATESAAAAEFEAATRLYDAKIWKKVVIPRPVARLAGEPRLVLYDFDPWLTLWEYLTFRRSFTALRRAAKRMGRMLARLHRSQVVLRREEPDLTGEGFRAILARTETKLQTLSGGSDLVKGVRVAVQRIKDAAAMPQPRTLAPVHGALGWDCIHYGVDSRFYLYRFETSRWSDPGLDLGGFAADLLRFTLANHDETVYQMCRDALLSDYNSEAERPIGEHDLRFYVVLALAERLGRAEIRTGAGAEQVLRALDAALRGGETKSGVSS